MAINIVSLRNSTFDADDIAIEVDNVEMAFCHNCIEHLVVLLDGTHGRYHSCYAIRMAEYELHMSTVHHVDEYCYDEDIPF